MSVAVRRSSVLRKSILTAACAASLTLAGAGLAAAGTSYETPITEVGAVTKANISVFRQTEPVEVPALVKSIVETDTKQDGKTFLGQNAELARPAYPDANHSRPPVWLIPGANENLTAYTLDANGKGAAGMGGPVSDEFFMQHGMIGWSPGRRGSNHRTRITVLLPDSIASIKIKTKRRGKKGKIRTYFANDNVVVANPKHAVAVIVNGARFPIKPIVLRQR